MSSPPSAICRNRATTRQHTSQARAREAVAVAHTHGDTPRSRTAKGRQN